VDITDRCLQAAIDICKPGTPVRKIGATIHAIAVGLYKPNPVVTHSA
jgi:methionine aminopeptidase